MNKIDVMKEKLFNIYTVYYMDNDRQKKVMGRKLSYHKAVELSQKLYTESEGRIDCFLEVI